MLDKENQKIIRNFESFNKIIKHIREVARISPGKVADAIGVHRNSQTNYERNRDPSIDYLVSFSHVTNTSFWGLIAERVRLGTATQEHKDKILREAEQIVNRLSFESLPKDSAEHTLGKNDQLTRVANQVCKEISFAVGNNGLIKEITQTSDSMQPTIQADATLLVDTADKSLTDGKLYAFETKNGPLIRRVQHLHNDDYLLVADNKLYEATKLKHSKVDQLDIIGRVLMSVNQH